MSDNVLMKHLQAARRELLDARERIDFQLAQLDGMMRSSQQDRNTIVHNQRVTAGQRFISAHLNEFGSEAIRKWMDTPTYPSSEIDNDVPAEAPADNTMSRIASAQRGPRPAMKDAVIAELERENREFTTNEIAVALHEKYDWSLSSVRSLMSKLAKSGEIKLVRRGVYRAWLAGNTWPNDDLFREFLDDEAPTDTSGPAVTGPEGDVATTGTGGDDHAQDGVHDPDRLEDGRIADHRGDPSLEEDHRPERDLP